MASAMTGIALGMIETRGLVPAIEAAGAKDFPSDLTIVGIIDHWQEN